MLVTFFLFPIYWLVIMSFKTANEIFAYPPVWWPGQLNFDNYAVLFRDGDWITVRNSVVLASVSTVIAMVLGTLSAYAIEPLPDRRREPRRLDHLATHVAAGRDRLPGLPPLCRPRLGRHLHRPDRSLRRLQPSLRDLDDARLHSGNPDRTRGKRRSRRLLALADHVEGRRSDGAHRPLRHRRLHLRFRLERLSLRPRPDPHGGRRRTPSR